MLKYIIVSIASGILFGVLDGVINGNPLARKLFEVYQPIARKSINIAAGIVIDLFYGFVMTLVYILLVPSLPGEIGLLKGLSYAVLVWFFRVIMSAASQWVMFNVPVKTALYTIVTGLGEMLILGVLFGLAF